jgi:hypothetical protein
MASAARKPPRRALRRLELVLEVAALGVRALGRELGRGEQLVDALDIVRSNRAGEQAVVMMWTASPERHQVPRRDRCRSRIGKPSMKTFIRIGIDLAKKFFQVHAIEREGAPAVRAS